MKVNRLNPILNVSDIQSSFAWFLSLGWTQGFQWGEPVGFGSMYNGDFEIFLCEDSQGGRGKGANTSTFGADGDEVSDKGVWISLWVENLDETFTLCTEAGVDITFAPTDMPWGVREMHIRHPDGHVFRITQGL